MSLVGRPAQNHPQQVAVRGAADDVDDRAITDEDFAKFHDGFRFTIDAAAAAHNAKLPRYWTREDSALDKSWAGERVWCNPPYSNIRPWIEKAWQEWVHADLIVMLLPANRTEQKWWQELVEPFREKSIGEPGLRVEFLPGRMRFLLPGQAVVPPNSRPPFGCCLLIWGDHAFEQRNAA